MSALLAVGLEHGSGAHHMQLSPPFHSLFLHLLFPALASVKPQFPGLSISSLVPSLVSALHPTLPSLIFGGLYQAGFSPQSSAPIVPVQDTGGVTGHLLDSGQAS